MKHSFTLPDFPDDRFEIQQNFFGAPSILKNGFEVERSSEKGRPYLLPAAGGSVVKAYPKPSFPDMIPQLEINGIKHRTVPKLPVAEYVVACLPLVLVAVGGGLGGLLGVLAMFLNLRVFRGSGTAFKKYAVAIAITLVAFVIWAAVANYLRPLLIENA